MPGTTFMPHILPGALSHAPNALSKVPDTFAHPSVEM